MFRQYDAGDVPYISKSSVLVKKDHISYTLTAVSKTILGISKS